MQRIPIWAQPTLLLTFTFFSLVGYTQESPAFQSLKKYYHSLPSSVMDTNWLMTPIDTGGMNYLLPLRQGLQREKNRTIFDTAAYYDLLSDALCRLTDYQTSQWYEKKLTGITSREEQTVLRQQAQPFINATGTDATSYILRQTTSGRIALFNASYLKPYTYVWIGTMLDSLRKQGYRHLALELLSPTKEPIQEISLSTGLFITEPVLGEFIRFAIAAGFSVFSCQPDYTISNLHERKKEQAMRLGNYFKKIPGDEKLLVITQPESTSGSNGNQLQPFSLYLSSWVGESCLSIDQCTLSSGSINAAGAFLYELISYQKPVNRPTVPLQNGQPLLWNDPYYSALVMHPTPSYNNQRPVWMGFYGKKKTIALPAAHPKSWLLQAFYLEEIQKRRPGNCIPADQTYQLSADGNYYLFLQPGKYRIIYRDKDNALLTFRDIEVNR